MWNNTTFSETVRDEIHLSLDELAQRGAQRMLTLALQAEVDEYIRRHEGERDENNYALVVRNGRSREQTIQCGAGVLKIQASRVYDKRPAHKFTSSTLPPYMRKSPRLEEAVPILYLRGLSTGDFGPALSALLGEEALAGYRRWRSRLLGRLGRCLS